MKALSAFSCAHFTGSKLKVCRPVRGVAGCQRLQISGYANISNLQRAAHKGGVSISNAAEAQIL
jgi:hypothetical protein